MSVIANTTTISNFAENSGELCKSLIFNLSLST